MRKNIFHVFVAVPWIDIYHWEGGGGGVEEDLMEDSSVKVKLEVKMEFLTFSF